MNQLKLVGKYFAIMVVVVAINHIFSLEYRESLLFVGAIYTMVWIIRNSPQMNILTILGVSVLDVGYILILLVVKGFVHGSIFFQCMVGIVPVFIGIMLAGIGRHREDAKKYPKKRLYVINALMGCCLVIFLLLIYLLE